MKFALGMPALILYPPVMSPWEPEATPADILRIAQTADDLGFDWLTISVFETNGRAAGLYERLGFGRDIVRLVKPLR